MYRKDDGQISFEDFGQATGVTLNPENRWVKKADCMPWEKIEEKYMELFTSDTGNVAKPVQLAVGALLIQTQYGFSDEETAMQIMETPALQYFCGMKAYREEMPFHPSLMTTFRKRITAEMIQEINEMVIELAKENDDSDNDSDNGNNGTLIVDATCAPQNIKYPQDIELLNEAREITEAIIDELHEKCPGKKPRTYRKKARKAYLQAVRKRKKTGKEIRKSIGTQLSFLRRNLGYIASYTKQGFLTKHKHYETILKLFEQQLFMYESKTHSVKNRIVSISQPYVRPIVRGKASKPVEFGAKLDLSTTGGYSRIEKISFEAYNEAETLIETIEKYKEREGHYPKRVLADKIYRNRNNLTFCKEHGIRLSGPALGRPKKDAVIDKKQDYIDICDRVEVERTFSHTKRSFGLGLIRTRLELTSLTAISLTILALNLAKSFACYLFTFFDFLRFWVSCRKFVVIK